MKIIVHGNDTVEKKLKKIEVYKCLDTNFNVRDIYDVGDYKILEFDQIELICRNYPDNEEKGYDLIFACDSEDRSRNLLYLGYWNDGVV